MGGGVLGSINPLIRSPSQRKQYNQSVAATVRRAQWPDLAGSYRDRMAEEQETKPAGGETVVEQDTSKAEEEANGSEEQEMGESNRAVILTNFGHSKNVVVAPNESKSITVEKPKASEAEVLIKVQAW